MRSRALGLRRAPLTLAGAVTAVLAAHPAPAQFTPARRAFEWSVAPWVGVSGFGTRYATPALGARYRSSLAAGLRGDLPLTRRLGVLANVEVAPFARQKASDAAGTVVSDEGTYVWRGDVGLGWRFKPTAPVFLYAGGGVVGASRPAYPGFTGSVLDPQAALAVGFDRPGTGRVNFRGVFTSYFVFPRELEAADWPGTSTPPPATAKSGVFDWTLQLGLRFRPRSAP